MSVEIYTDGACSGNPGKGGYAFIVLLNGKEMLKMSGCEFQTTNNRMELKAIVRAIEHLDFMFRGRQIDVKIYSDSAYCINPITKGWLSFWKSNEWKTKQNVFIKNSDLWMKLEYLLNNKKYKFTFVKIKGHSGLKYNEMVDKAAKNAINCLNSLKNFQAEEVQ